MQAILVTVGCLVVIAGLLIKAGVVDVTAIRRLFQPYRAKDLMTPNEQDMFARLVRALPGHYVFPQVAMGAIVESAPRLGEAVARGVRSRFDRKIVDFLVVDSHTFDVVAIVELDDRTHVASKDQARDGITAAAGYRTVRFQARRKPDATEIRRELGIARREAVEA